MFIREIKFVLLIGFVLLFLCANATTLNISFTSESGSPKYKNVIIMRIDNPAQQVVEDMSRSDSATVEVDDNTDYFVLGAASDATSVEGYIVHEYVPVSKAFNSGTGEKDIDLVTEPAYSLVFQNEDFPDTDIFAVDMDDGYLPVISLDVTNSGGDSLPSITLPLGKCYAFYIFKELPQSGKMMYRVDNKGEGFCADLQGNLMVDTDMYLAESVIKRYEDIINETAVEKTLHEEKFSEIKALYDNGEFKKSAGKAIYYSEELVFEEGKLNIERNRKGKVYVKITDRKGNSFPGIKVTATPLETEYKRGVLAGIYDRNATVFSNAFDDGFNFATVGTLWLDVEPQDNNYRWDYIDKVAGNITIHDMGYELFGHSILYFMDMIMPEYLKTMSVEEIKDEITEHTTALTEHYQDEINEWLVINEAHTISASYGFSREEITEFADTAIEAINKIKPESIKTINAAPDYFGMSKSMEMFMPDHESFFSMPVYQYFQDLNDREIDYDVIGQQMYNGGCVTLFKDNGLSDSASAVAIYDLVELRRHLRKLQTLEKPVYVTEISVPAGMNDECEDMGYWRKEWSEDIQKQYLERLLTMIMGEKGIHAVNYWDMLDEGSFIYKGGLIDETGRKKPAYEAAEELFGDFLKTVETESDSEGVAQLDLYAGEYEINIDDGKKVKTISIGETGQVSLEYQSDVEQNSDDSENDDSDNSGKGCSAVLL